ncbi:MULTISPECIES: glycoside hydrolase family 43 protein [unclassified Streptomyces]|uniref:glycoside hydrolase family 43 protein n=1 Tax=unclassified Streptomyces TaxID=2593676 RepID=UPI0009405052|nr:glycoside hydrolase family 43 protein [Streptomyces sp. CB02058]OKI97986.1 beta-xylosidase [Streptomyces sp. CB02058]
MTAVPTASHQDRSDRRKPDDGRTPAIVNPVLPGFHPDPSILRVGEDYYIATSTFEWLPGVAVHHSRDLVNWRSLGGILGEKRLIDLTGRPDSGGVWAPCLSYTDGLFHLVYSDVTNLSGAFKDVRNHVITAPALDGPWSDPAPFPSHGFDPSLFHDDGPDGDGRSWALWMEWDHRPGRHPFAGILLQEWDRVERRVTGPMHRVFTGTPLAHTEGPHVYRHDGWYYLMTAEGGTSWSHAVTVARSRNLTGPYEADPAGPLLTSAGHDRLPLQKAGHGSLVATPGGEWFLAHLTARPLTPLGSCVLGRETAIQRVVWTADGWPRLDGEPPAGHEGGSLPRTVVPGPALPPAPSPPRPARDHFDRTALDTAWATLRRHPDPSWMSLTERPGHLRLRGGQSLGSTHGQSVVARRQQSTDFHFSARLTAEPRSPLQMAGIVHYYNSTLWHYLHLTWDETLGRVLRVGLCAHGEYSEPAAAVAVPDGAVELRLSVRGPQGSFAWRTDQDSGWQRVGPDLDVTRLSDESATLGDPATGHFTSWGFTGAFAGLSAQDLTGTAMAADFAWAQYLEHPEEASTDRPGTW